MRIKIEQNGVHTWQLLVFVDQTSNTLANRALLYNAKLSVTPSFGIDYFGVSAGAINLADLSQQNAFVNAPICRKFMLYKGEQPHYHRTDPGSPKQYESLSITRAPTREMVSKFSVQLNETPITLYQVTFFIKHNLLNDQYSIRFNLEYIIGDLFDYFVGTSCYKDYKTGMLSAANTLTWNIHVETNSLPANNESEILAMLQRQYDCELTSGIIQTNFARLCLASTDLLQQAVYSDKVTNLAENPAYVWRRQASKFGEIATRTRYRAFDRDELIRTLQEFRPVTAEEVESLTKVLTQRRSSAQKKSSAGLELKKVVIHHPSYKTKSCLFSFGRKPCPYGEDQCTFSHKDGDLEEYK